MMDLFNSRLLVLYICVCVCVCKPLGLVCSLLNSTFTRPE